MTKNKFVFNTPMVLKRLLFALVFTLPAIISFAQTQEKIFYDKDWKGCREANAEYYALVNFDNQGNPVGKVNFYYITGEFKSDADGALSIDKDDFNQSKRIGLSKGFYISGQKEFETLFDKQGNPIKEKVWHVNGNLKYEVKFKNGKLHGKYVHYYENGKRQQKGSYKDGKLDGNRVDYYETGKISVKGNYKDGVEDGNFADYHENGKISAKYKRKAGEFDGNFALYDENGELKDEGTYKNGKLIAMEPSSRFNGFFQIFEQLFDYVRNIKLYQWSEQSLGLLALCILVIFILLFRPKPDKTIDAASMPKQNKIINVPLYGGIIGALSSSPLQRLNKEIRAANAQGWKVLRIIPSASGNLFLSVWRIILLCITLFFFTTKNGFYVVIEKANNGSNISN